MWQIGSTDTLLTTKADYKGANMNKKVEQSYYTKHVAELQNADWKN